MKRALLFMALFFCGAVPALAQHSDVTAILHRGSTVNPYFDFSRVMPSPITYDIPCPTVGGTQYVPMPNGQVQKANGHFIAFLCQNPDPSNSVVCFVDSATGNCATSNGGGGGTPCVVTPLTVQFNNAGALGCMTEFTYTSGTKTMAMGANGILDLGAGARLQLPFGAGFAPTVNGRIGYDTTLNAFRGGINGTAAILPWGSGATPVNGNCTQWSTPAWKMTDAGGPCLTQSSGVFLATTYGVTGDAKFALDVTITNLSQTVTCPANDCNFVAGDVGKIIWGTNGGYPFNVTNSTVILPQGTITAINNAQSIQVSIAATASSGAALGVIVWGTDDTAAMNTAVTAAWANCDTLQLARASIVQSSLFGISGPQCNVNTGAHGFSYNQTRKGVGLIGLGTNGSLIIPSANFNFATCTLGLSGKACFGGASSLYAANFSIWGSGQDQGAENVVLFEENAGSQDGVGAGARGEGTYIQNINLLGWRSNDPNAIGFLGDGCGAFCVVDHLEVNGFGAGNGATPTGAVQFNGTATPPGAGTWEVRQLLSNDQAGPALVINGAQVATTQSGFNTDILVDGINIVNVTGVPGTGGWWWSFQDSIAMGSTNQQGGIVLFNGSTARVDQITVSNPNSAGDASYFSELEGGSSLYISNSYTDNGSNGFIFSSTTGNKFFDLGGNIFKRTGSSTISAGVTVFGSRSATGTTILTGGIVLTSGWDTSSKSAISGSSELGQFTVTAAGVPGPSPVITLTFPVKFTATPICSIQQVAGTFGTLTNPVASGLSATGVAFTWTGTPVAAQVYTFQYSCRIP